MSGRKRPAPPPSDPRTYLSTSHNAAGVRVWRVVHNNAQLHADFPVRAAAEAVAAHFKLTLPSVVWDGDAGRFVDEVAP